MKLKFYASGLEPLFPHKAATDFFKEAFDVDGMYNRVDRVPFEIVVPPQYQELQTADLKEVITKGFESQGWKEVVISF